MVRLSKLVFLATTVLFIFEDCQPFSLMSSPTNGSTVYTCVDGEANFPWTLHMSSTEDLVEIQWFHQTTTKELVAIFAGGHFIPMPEYAHRVSQILRAGLRLTNVTASDSGDFIIEASGHSSSGSYIEYSKYVRLDVQTGADSPRVSGGRLHVTQHPDAVKTSGEWHLKLKCGSFLSRGHPAINVVWTTPSGRMINSHTFEGGYSVLMVPNPVEHGSYSCRILSSDPAAVCLTSSDSVMQIATHHVNSMEARIMLVEALNGELFQENALLKQKTSDHDTKISTLEKELTAHLHSSLHTVRLVGGSRMREGRVELRRSNQWHTVCDDSWDSADARVICRMLGYSWTSASTHSSAFYGQGTGSIILDDVNCGGSEEDIYSCSHRSLYDHNCGHNEDAGVLCYHHNWS